MKKVRSILFVANIPTENNTIFSEEMLIKLANSREDCYFKDNKLIMEHNITENEYRQLIRK